MRRGVGRTASRRGSGITTRLPPAVVAAAGRGVRAQTHPQDSPKQFRELAGRPLILWSIDALSSAGCAELVAVVPSELVDRARTVIGSAAIVVAGGNTRQQSVANGLAYVTADTVVVHDAARPMLTRGLVERVVAALEGVDGAIAAVPVGETIKRAEAGYVTATIDRSALWLAQTPQAFRTDVLAAAHARASRDGFESTDDAQLVERYGGRVAVVESSPANLKITYADDFVVAEAVLAGRRS